MNELYYILGVDRDGDLVEAIGRPADLFITALRWFRRGVTVLRMREYRRAKQCQS